MHVSLYPSVSASERECVCVCVYEVCVCWFGLGEFQLCQSELVQMPQLPKEQERGNRRGKRSGRGGLRRKTGIRGGK